MRFGQHGVLTHGWAKRGTRPTAAKQMEYDWAYVFGAVCPATGESSAMIAATVNIGLMNQHLRWISESVRATPAGEIVQVILILDNAGWHRSPRVEWPKNITPHFLPAYSPELNPVERLWRRVRLNGLSNSILPSGELLQDRGAEAWNRLTPADIKSICRVAWLAREN